VVAGASALISVSAAEEAQLAGTKLSIPANGLALDTNITLETGGLPLSANPAGPIAVWGPPGLKFKSPARMTLPVTLPEGVVAEDLYIEVLEATGEQKTIDAVALEGNLVSFDVEGFTAFQPSARSCTSNTQCSAGKACVSGRCRRITVDGGSQCTADADCSAGASCQSGVCQAAQDGGPAVDAGVDAGTDGGQLPDAGRDGGFTCTVNADCAVGGTCQGGVCMFPAQDGGPAPDSGVDGGRPDAGPTDGGPFLDGGNPSDGGNPGGGDGGVVTDGGVSDGGAPDSGIDGGPAGCNTNLDCATFQRCVNFVCQ
jgi:hypothetical protein